MASGEDLGGGLALGPERSGEAPAFDLCLAGHHKGGKRDSGWRRVGREVGQGEEEGEEAAQEEGRKRRRKRE